MISSECRRVDALVAYQCNLLVLISAGLKEISQTRIESIPPTAYSFLSKSSTWLPNTIIIMRTSGSNSAVVGFCIGLFIGLVVLYPAEDTDRTGGCATSPTADDVSKASLEYTATTTLATLKSDAEIKRNQSSFRRPRYFYTELGLRKKLCLNVLMTEKNETDLLLALNATAARYVDRFNVIIAGNATSSIVQGLKELGFKNVIDINQVKNSKENIDLKTAKNQRLSYDKYETVIRLLGYLRSSKIPNNYDYFAFVPAKLYFNAKAVLEVVSKTSVSQDVAWGRIAGRKCDVDHGFILSSRLVKNFGAKSEICYLNLALDVPDHFEKCLDMIYMNFPCTEMHTDSNGNRSSLLMKIVENPKEVYSLHRESLAIHHERLDRQVKKLQDDIARTHKKVPEKFRKELQSWPIGYPEAPLPKSRYDVKQWIFIRHNQKFDGSSTTANASLKGTDALDTQRTLNSTLSFLTSRTGQSMESYQVRGLYRRFDPIRGLEYFIDLDNNVTKKPVRVQAMKALSKMEIAPVPYVTENKKVYIVVPVMFEPVAAIESFLNRYFDLQKDKKDNTVLILLILTPANDNLPPPNRHVPSPADIETIKKVIERYNIRVGKGSLSTEAPKASYILVPKSNTRSSNPFLSGIDAVIKRIIGADSIIFTADLSVTFEDALLNRVRISAIKGWQAFNPVPFVQYHPSVSKLASNASLTVSKNQGYFNPSFQQFFGFYSSDYLQARKTLNASLQASLNSLKDFGVLQKLFVRQLPHISILRAPDPNFRLRRQYLDNQLETDSTRFCLSIKCGNKNQLSRYIFGDDFQDLYL